MVSRLEREEVLSKIKALHYETRKLVAIAGPPGSGKSTFADWVVGELNRSNPAFAVVLAMDGFHYDNVVLEQMQLLPRKGSPNTFDVGGLENTLYRLVKKPYTEIFVPVFDRDLEVARAGAREISKETKCIIIEGNYLLSSSSQWNRLTNYFDLKILIEVEYSILEQRLRSRWEGYKLTEEEIQHKLYVNDLPNGEFVYSTSADVDIVYAQDL